MNKVALALSIPVMALCAPTCEIDGSPDYPAVGQPPAIKIFDREALSANWIPPACTGWQERGFSSLLITAARFRDSAGADGLLRKIGAISELKGIQYWSTTHQKWRTLILDAFAVTAPLPGHRRADFSPADLATGEPLYFEQEDSLSGKAIYRMRMITTSPDRIVFDTENVSTLHYLLIPIFHPGDAQSFYSLERESKDVWRYYNIARIGKNANSLAAGHEASSINRAVAFYRHVAGIPTNEEPPAAR
jgi:hypothetical protein